VPDRTPRRRWSSAFRLRILIANPFPAFRHRIITLLRENFSVSRIGEADNGNDALALLRSDSWDAAILGVRLPIGGGIHFFVNNGLLCPENNGLECPLFVARNVRWA
jgi:hypothetical protein